MNDYDIGEDIYQTVTLKDDGAAVLDTSQFNEIVVINRV